MKLSTKTKTSLLKWMAAPGGVLPQPAVEEIRKNQAIRPKESVTLYRGMLFSGANAEKALRSMMGKKFMFKSASYTSWTHSIAVAQKFAKYNKIGTGYAILDVYMASTRFGIIDGEIGILLSREFRPEDILVDTTMVQNKMTDRKFADEREAIVDPFSGQCEIVRVFTQKGEYLPEEYAKRPIDNNYDQIKKYLKKAVESVRTDVVRLTNKMKSFKNSDWLVEDLRTDAERLHKKFHRIWKNRPCLDVPEYGSKRSDVELHRKLHEIYKYMNRFDTPPPLDRLSLRYTEYYYIGLVIGEVYNKNVDKMKHENREKLANKLTATYGQGFAMRYGFNTDFNGNSFFLMKTITSLTDKL